MIDRRLVALVAGCLTLGAMLWLAQRIAVDRTIERERERLGEIATLAASNFRRQVDTFELVATTLSADPEVRRVLEPGDPAAASRLNDRLATLTGRLDASVIYLMNRQGTTVVSSNWRQPDSFMGENYRFRRYFTQALADGQSSQFALGTRSGIPGLFLTRRIDSQSGPVGVLVVKIRFDNLEREWAKSIGEAFVTDADGVIIVTSRPETRFRTVASVPQNVRRQLRDRRSYGQAPLTQHPAFAAGDVLASGRWSGQRLLAAAAELGSGRKLVALAPIRTAAVGARNVAWLTVLLAAVLVVGGLMAFLIRRRAVTAREETIRQQQIGELRDRLEQANRLSSLGQMAAGVGHEINQPLAAIGMRAGSAARLVALGRTDEAGSAMKEIEGLVDRIGTITGELHNFARRSERKLGAVSLKTVCDGVSLLVGDAVRQKKARLEFSFAEDGLVVRAEATRLEQVLVNLVKNALDAGGDGTLIRCDAIVSGARVRIAVSDNGPGIDPAVRTVLFQPFMTTKDSGLGLGLVISRDIVAEFGGELTLVESGPAGTTFLIELERAG
ncbi:sensor histidine kinase [Sphingopyxis sp. FD7]|uniref:sensor histidine kinase n=1 Tax=Sphingopyxis sp. FD7 TaxID=1914525 RepID=UPI000DC620F3|nr:ATP-binding protein [Sphingopyxis sp. FD7]BBB14525.1 signal transduction histidine kinase [Sphingopyxis sp. FD7]